MQHNIVHQTSQYTLPQLVRLLAKANSFFWIAMQLIPRDQLKDNKQILSLYRLSDSLNEELFKIIKAKEIAKMNRLAWHFQEKSFIEAGLADIFSLISNYIGETSKLLDEAFASSLYASRASGDSAIFGSVNLKFTKAHDDLVEMVEERIKQRKLPEAVAESIATLLADYELEKNILSEVIHYPAEKIEQLDKHIGQLNKCCFALAKNESKKEEPKEEPKEERLKEEDLQQKEKIKEEPKEENTKEKPQKNVEITKIFECVNKIYFAFEEFLKVDAIVFGMQLKPEEIEELTDLFIRLYYGKSQAAPVFVLRALALLTSTERLQHISYFNRQEILIFLNSGLNNIPYYLKEQFDGALKPVFSNYHILRTVAAGFEDINRGLREIFESFSKEMENKKNDQADEIESLKNQIARINKYIELLPKFYQFVTRYVMPIEKIQETYVKFKESLPEPSFILSQLQSESGALCLLEACVQFHRQQAIISETAATIADLIVRMEACSSQKPDNKTALIKFSTFAQSAINPEANLNMMFSQVKGLLNNLFRSERKCENMIKGEENESSLEIMNLVGLKTRLDSIFKRFQFNPDEFSDIKKSKLPNKIILILEARDVVEKMLSKYFQNEVMLNLGLEKEETVSFVLT